MKRPIIGKELPRNALALIFLFFLANCALHKTESPRVVVLEKYSVVLEQSVTYFKVHSHYYPLKSSPITDTLYIVNEMDPERSNLLIHLDRKEYRFPKRGELSIYVDTSRIVGNWGEITWFDSMEYVIPHAEIAYPVTLLNVSKDSLSVGGMAYIPLELEAIDSNGQWRPIESFEPKIRRNWYDSMQHVLPPRHLTVTTLSIPSGNYPTQLRLSWNGNYSNAVYGWIHYGQFEYKGE
ncbi:MAG: hypothetical protein ACYC1Q_09035 [Bacteroidia bacterium]